MNKLRHMIRQLSILAVTVGAIVAGAGVAWYVTGNMADSAADKKKQADTSLSQDTSQLNTVSAQLDRSGEAEKRFIDIEASRTGTDFTDNVDTMKAWMRDAKAHYRFANNFKLSLPPEKPTDKADLQGLDYDITQRTDATIDLEAISDLHIFSFLEAMQKSAPGIVRITEFTVERRGDIQPSTYAQLTGGMTPYLATARIKFNWVGINPKDKGDKAAAAKPPAAAGGNP